MVIAKAHLKHLLDFDDGQKRDLADILRRVTCRYDNLFQCSFPYSMGIHQAPAYPHVVGEKFSELVNRKSATLPNISFL
jgi:UDPglucose--hexose-1-phosphate uridylyltransferase